MIFAFSKDNHYSHYSVNFVLYYNKYSGGTIEIEYMSNQALMYNDLIDGYDVFCTLYTILWRLKKELPNNKLIKKFGSFAWGELQSKINIWKTEEEIIDERLDISF